MSLIDRSKQLDLTSAIYGGIESKGADAAGVTQVNLLARARRTLSRISNASLATVTETGDPWNTPVFVAFDADLTFYWSSNRDAVHSINIAQHEQVMLVVFDSRAHDASGHAVYIAATARELANEPQMEVALDVLARRRREPPKPVSDFRGGEPRRLYAAVPSTIWTNLVKQQNGHFFDERVRIDLR